MGGHAPLLSQSLAEGWGAELQLRHNLLLLMLLLLLLLILHLW